MDALNPSQWTHTSALLRRRSGRFTVTMCLGTILVGTCPTSIVRRSIDSTASGQTEKVSSRVHVFGAACAFILMPTIEVLIVLFYRERQRSNARPVHVGILQKILTGLGLLLFFSFSACNLWAGSTYQSMYKKQGWCGIPRQDEADPGEDDYYIGNECRDHYLGWQNLLAFWLEYACANCAIALLGIRIFSITPASLARLAEVRHWVIRMDDPLDSHYHLNWGVKRALSFQAISSVLSIIIMMYGWEQQSNFCCTCNLTGNRCEAIYQNLNHGGYVCTHQKPYTSAR